MVKKGVIERHRKRGNALFKSISPWSFCRDYCNDSPSCTRNLRPPGEPHHSEETYQNSCPDGKHGNLVGSGECRRFCQKDSGSMLSLRSGLNLSTYILRVCSLVCPVIAITLLIETPFSIRIDINVLRPV